MSLTMNLDLPYLFHKVVGGGSTNQCLPTIHSSKATKLQGFGWAKEEDYYLLQG